MITAAIPSGSNFQKEMSWQVLAFCRLLKRLDLDVTLNRVIDSFRSLEVVDVASREDFYLALRANLTSRREDIPVFDRAFDLFWRRPPDEDEDSQCGESCSDAGGDEGSESLEQKIVELFVEEWLKEGEENEDSDEEAIPGYSPKEVLAAKDFSAFGDDDLRQIRTLIDQLAPKIATRLSRRTKADARGHDFDPRRTLRANIKYAGDIVELPRRKRKITKSKLVLLCDVSGSMDCYSRFLIQFIYALQNQLKGVETFVFSTRLSRVTNMLRTRDIYDGLNRISTSVLDWSGGTSIGSCLHAFNDGVGKTVVSSKSVVVIVSDGWDRGDCDVLGGEMRRLRTSCHKVIWLNPLAGSPNYQPICSGMKAAMPYVDYFLPAHNLNSLMALIKVLRDVSKH
ncbi:MAG: VWA domain-containing protein [Chloroflexi bacterium]|nr:VWA domain-containing protein [Chloroflexota bacterium]